MIPGDGHPMLSIRGLRHTFHLRGRARGEVQALRGVDLDLFPGECLALVGESGSGKTTLARAILRLIRPVGGTILYMASGRRPRWSSRIPSAP